MSHRNRHITLIATLGILASMLQFIAVSTTDAMAPPVTWSDPEPIGEDISSSWFPEIQTDQYGTVRLVWESVRDPEDPTITEANGGAIMLSELRDGKWTQPSDIYIKDVLNAARPILASDDSYLHLISRSPRPEGRITIQALSALYYMRAPLTRDVTNAQSWSTPIRLTSGPAYWAQLLTLPSGRLVAAYNVIIESEGEQSSDQVAGDATTALFVRISDDYGETWQQPVRISSPGDRVARSSLVVSGANGTLILAWDEGYDNLTGEGEASGIYTATSSDNGNTWVAGGRLDPPQSSDRLVSFASRGVVESNTLISTPFLTMLVYRSTVEDVLLYRLSPDQGRTWLNEFHIPNAVAREFTTPHNFEKLALASDSDGRIILAYVGQDENSPSGLSVMVTTYEDNRWTVPSVVASPEGFPEYPRLTVVNGNQVHLAFFVRDQAFVDAGHYVIWTATGRTSAQRVESPSNPSDSVNTQPTPEPASDSDSSIQLTPYPTPPVATELSNHPDELESPGNTISQPIMRASILTAGLLLVFVIAFRILKRLTGF